MMSPSPKVSVPGLATGALETEVEGGAMEGVGGVGRCRVGRRLGAGLGTGGGVAGAVAPGV